MPSKDSGSGSETGQRDVPDHVPDQYRQAMEAARDGLSMTDLVNMVISLPAVLHADVYGDEPWANAAIDVSFNDSHGRGTDYVLTIMRRAGWRPVDVTFSRERITFEERDGDE